MVHDTKPRKLKPATYQGEFCDLSWGTVSTTGGWSTPVVGDFNGDGRDDLAAFNDIEPGRQAMAGDDVRSAPRSCAGNLVDRHDGDVARCGSVVAGDFNGDGRDDLIFKKSGTDNWAIAISDGSRFNVVDPASPVTTTWTIEPRR